MIPLSTLQEAKRKISRVGELIDTAMRSDDYSVGEAIHELLDTVEMLAKAEDGDQDGQPRELRSKD